MPNTPQDVASMRTETNKQMHSGGTRIMSKWVLIPYSNYFHLSSFTIYDIRYMETILLVPSSEENSEPEFVLCCLVCCCRRCCYCCCCYPRTLPAPCPPVLLGLFMTHKSGRQHVMRIHKQHATIRHVLLVNFARATFLRN